MENFEPRWLISGAIVAALAVIFGAFGAHILENRVKPDLLDTFEIAVRYQMYHGLALLFLSIIAQRIDTPWIEISGIAFLGGIIIFSGSLYLLVLTNTKWLGAITPIGGVAFIIGWVALIIAAVNT